MNSHIKQPPKAVGLYDPRFEHDACGVGMVARLDNVPTHEVIVRAITALENLEHRGASGADPCTGDGAGILMQMPDELLRSVVDFDLPPPGEYGVLMCFLPTDAAARARLEALLERNRARRGPAAARLARRADRRAAHGGGRGRLPAGDPPAVRGGRGGPAERPRRVRAQAVRDPPDQRSDRAGARPVRRVELLADDQLQGHADQLPAGAVLHGPARRAHQERARARALALLDQHVPELGARAPLPGDLPQRRDQHGDGQRQLDARARERAAQRAVRRGPREDPAGRHPRQLRLGDVRQRARAADARRPLAAARGDDDDPRGVPRPRGPARPPEGLLRLPLVPDGAVGRARVGGVHRRPRGRARRSTATGFAPDAGSRRPTGTWCSARSPACSTSRPSRFGDWGACSRASCSWSTSSGGGSSRTRRSSARSPPATPTASGSRATPSPSPSCRRPNR